LLRLDIKAGALNTGEDGPNMIECLYNASVSRRDGGFVAGVAAGKSSDTRGTNVGRESSAVWHFEHSIYKMYNTPGQLRQ